MKTKWTYDYLINKFGDNRKVLEWCAEKQSEFETQFPGVKWAYYPFKQYILFRPSVDFKNPDEIITDPELVEKFIEGFHSLGYNVMGGQGFLWIAEASGLTIRETIGVAHHLIQNVRNGWRGIGASYKQLVVGIRGDRRKK